MQKKQRVGLKKEEGMAKKLNNHVFFVMLYIILLCLGLLPYYINGTIILGGEGDYVFDFSTQLSNFGFMWFSIFGLGLQNLSPSGTGLNIILLWLISKLTASIVIANFVLIFSIYFFPFLAMFLVCKEMKIAPFLAFILSFFYVINPFVLYYLNCINQWNVFSVTVMPLFLWVILRYYNSYRKLFFIFGFISTCFSFTYSNPPLLAIIHISIILSMFVVSHYYHKKIIFSQILKRYGVVLAAFIVFNLWWILNLFTGAISYSSKVYSASWAHDWLDTTVSGHGAILAKMFSITTMVGDNPSYDFFTFWYNTIFSRVITLTPTFIVIYFVLIAKDKKTSNLFNRAILLCLLTILFFVKGNSGPFGFIYDFMFRHVPFFYVFKSPVEKFGLLYVFVFSILLLFIMTNIRSHKYYKPALSIFIIYLIFCSIPLLTGNIIPDSKLGESGYYSRKYKDKDEYVQFRKVVNNDNFQYRVLSLPGRGNYQVCMPNYNNKKYVGLDPVLMNINKPFIAPQHQIGVLYDNLSSDNYVKLLGLYNIGKIMLNEDLLPWFGTREKESSADIKRIFGKYMASKKWGGITLYSNKDYFLPKIYVSGSPN